MQEQSLDFYIEQIKQIGFKSFSISYSGSGDSGAIDEIEYELLNEFAEETGYTRQETSYDYESKKWLTREVPATVRDILEEYAYAYLEHHHGGWEINDGQSGTIEFDGKTITHEGQSYYTESTDISEEYEIYV